MLRSVTAVVLGFVLIGSVKAESWEERMWRQLNRKVSLELVDASLSDACSLLTSICGANIILAPKVRTADPHLTIKLQDMDAGTALKWFTQLTDTHADVVDQAIFINDVPNKDAEKQEKDAILELAAKERVEVTLPADGTPLSNQDRVKIALEIAEKTTPKIQDFPGPELELGASGKNGAVNPFGGQPGK
ncbi:MAG TPA: hypothetical protein VGP72_06895 [Planctomycetota bacterium]|jgi:hypothetical protein